VAPDLRNCDCEQGGYAYLLSCIRKKIVASSGVEQTVNILEELMIDLSSFEQGIVVAPVVYALLGAAIYGLHLAGKQLALLFRSLLGKQAMDARREMQEA
jgi:hypothetical protein